MRNLLDFNIEDLEGVLAEIGQPKFHAKQIFKWLSRGVDTIDQMTDLSKALRDKLKEAYTINKLQTLKKLTSKIDGTAKYLFLLDGKNVIESVLMKYQHGLSVCISSQVGCRMGCKFCASTELGFERNLTAGEMLDQVLAISKDAGERVGNVVIMGIGEPLDNYDNIIKFLKILNHELGLNIGYRHISLSTCGLVPQILKLAKESLPITLSVSLHAPNDEIRDKTMPINKTYRVDKLIEACKIYSETTKRRITFEYALIEGVNNSSEHAIELAHKLKRMLCHVNLIPINSIGNTGFEKGSRNSVYRFQDVLRTQGIEATIRRELGADIEAACGQLRKSYLSDTKE